MVVVVAGVVDVVTMSSHLFPANPDGQEQIPLTHVPLLRQEKALGQPLKRQDSQHSYSSFILIACSIPKHSWVCSFHVRPLYLFSGLDKKQISNESVYPIRSLVNLALFAIPVVFLHVIPATKNKGQI